MELSLSWQSLVTTAAVLGAGAAVTAYFAKAVRWMDRQKRQDRELAAIKEEQTLLTYGVLACLKGLKEQGCNGPVSEAIGKIEKHLNQRAHK